MQERKTDQVRIGKRLVRLRKLMSEQTQTEWTTAMVAKGAKIKEEQLVLLEVGLLNKVDIFRKVLFFYHDKGYKATYVLRPWACPPEHVEHDWTAEEEEYQEALWDDLRMHLEREKDFHRAVEKVLVSRNLHKPKPINTRKRSLVNTIRSFLRI